MKTATVIPIRDADGWGREAELADILADPITIAVMRADRVNPVTLRILAAQIANKLRENRVVESPTRRRAGI